MISAAPLSSGIPTGIELDDVAVAAAVDDLEPGRQATDLAAEDAPRRAHVGPVAPCSTRAGARQVDIRSAPCRFVNQALSGASSSVLTFSASVRLGVAEIDEGCVANRSNMSLRSIEAGSTSTSVPVVVDEQRIVGEELRLLRTGR